MVDRRRRFKAVCVADRPPLDLLTSMRPKVHKGKRRMSHCRRPSRLVFEDDRSLAVHQCKLGERDRLLSHLLTFGRSILGLDRIQGTQFTANHFNSMVSLFDESQARRVSTESDISLPALALTWPFACLGRDLVRIHS